jgi:hypothetical protein
VWNGLNWVTIGSTFKFHKRREFLEELSDYQLFKNSVELVSLCKTSWTESTIGDRDVNGKKNIINLAEIAREAVKWTRTGSNDFVCLYVVRITDLQEIS